MVLSSLYVFYSGNKFFVTSFVFFSCAAFGGKKNKSIGDTPTPAKDFVLCTPCLHIASSRVLPGKGLRPLHSLLIERIPLHTQA